jgi:putative pyruvate formate lyase activating enzyme
VWRFSRPDAVAVLEDESARKSLGRYFSVLKDEKPAKFMLAKKLPATWSETDSLQTLWIEHAKRSVEFSILERQIDKGRTFEEVPSPERSYLDLKNIIANKIVQSCHFCTRRS